MGIVDEAIEDGVGIGRIADDLVPDRYWQLAGDDRRAAAVALLEDFEQVGLVTVSCRCLISLCRLGFECERADAAQI